MTSLFFLFLSFKEKEKQINVGTEDSLGGVAQDEVEKVRRRQSVKGLGS